MRGYQRSNSSGDSGPAEGWCVEPTTHADGVLHMPTHSLAGALLSSDGYEDEKMPRQNHQPHRQMRVTGRATVADTCRVGVPAICGRVKGSDAMVPFSPSLMDQRQPRIAAARRTARRGQRRAPPGAIKPTNPQRTATSYRTPRGPSVGRIPRESCRPTTP